MISDLVAYRTATDRIFEKTISTPDEWRCCFQGILAACVQLYLDYLWVAQHENQLWDHARTIRGEAGTPFDPGRERAMRHKLAARIKESPPWEHFEAPQAFCRWTGLWERREYIERFSIHLPEIYEEAIRTEASIKTFLATKGKRAASQVECGLDHLACNHIAFVLQALQMITKETAWPGPEAGRRGEALHRVTGTTPTAKTKTPNAASINAGLKAPRSQVKASPPTAHRGKPGAGHRRMIVPGRVP